eukprot:s718_g2.t2
MAYTANAMVCKSAQGVGDLPLDRLFSEAPEAVCGVGAASLLELLRAKRLSFIKDLVHLPPWELRDWLLITEEEATSLLRRAWSACAAKPVSAWELATQSHATRPSRLAPLPSLQAALGGSPALVEVAGPPGVGKTQFCLHAAALTAASGGEVFWLDAERSFSAQRLLEMLEHLQPGEAAMQALQRVRHKVCGSLQELHSIVSELSQSKAAGSVTGALPALLVIDSVAAVARRESNVEKPSIPRRQAALSSLASLLKVLVAPSIEVTSNVPSVVVTNQVMGDPSGAASATRVSLGQVWHHAVNWRLVLSHVPPGPEGPGSKEQADPFGRRYLLVEKSPCCATLTIPFNICEQGLKELR